MPLILAIVADHHQAAQLTALVKRLNVDLVQAAEVGEGLLALNDRIPDLVLTSPLMSPFDDGVLDEYLRDLGSAGAHVQSLRIPVLSSSTKESKRGGFSLFGRAKGTTHTLEGCDPKVFADEITQYLIRAAEEKDNAQANQAQGGSGQLETVPPGDEWSTTPGPQETWDPIAWQADAHSAQPETDSPAPLYNPIENESAYRSVESDSAYRDQSIPADIYVPEPAIEVPPSLIRPEVEPPAAPAFDATAYAPVEEEPASIPALAALPEDPTPAPAPSLDPDEPVVRAPLSLFAGVEATTDPTEHLQSVAAEPIVLPEPIVLEPIVPEPIVAGPIVVEPTVPERMVAEPIAAEPMIAEEIVADPIVAGPIVAEPIAAAPPEPEASAPLPNAPSMIKAIEAEAPPVSTDTIAAPEPDVVATPVEARSAEAAAPPESLPPVAEKHTPKLTASFRSALAAIRAAWDAPAKSAPPVVKKPTETAILGLRETAPIEAPPASEPLAQAAAPIEPLAAAEPPAAFDDNVTGVVELIDGDAADVQPLEPSVDVEGLAEPAGEASEVYELTVEPDLQELESKLLAPLEPRVARPSPSEEPVGRASETRSDEGRSTKDAPRARRGKSSKKGGKAAAAKPRRQDKGPVQDEWGIFDPDRCGFAALVDKLEEVSEEKEQEQTPRKGTKVRVISYS